MGVRLGRGLDLRLRLHRSMRLRREIPWLSEIGSVLLMVMMRW